MKAFRIGLAFAALMLVGMEGAGGQAAAVSELDIRNYHRISDEIAVAGQPSDEALKKIKEAGFRTILNLRDPSEGIGAEQKKVEALGLAYVNIPITTHTITQVKVKRFVEIVSEPSNKPLFIHCASGNRVGGMWFLYRRLVGQLPEDKALQEAKEVGLKSPVLEATVVEYARKCPSLETPCH